RTRSPALPDVPTIAESGLPGFHDSTFNGVVAPAGTPPEIVAHLQREVAKAVAVGELRQRFREQGIELVASASPQAFAVFLRGEVESFARLAREAGITIKPE